ncbi:hypothetical protein SAMN05216192_104190 [Paenibacillus typhae]|uniref:Uncharacterized protein n=1 Tax=Paenibacillus typhae TaxID=1174501 RepID=A0A1G8JHQ9_9BACL|nr:hypothetical protein SAMN05216192_104190 [Paenibacillus typhae]
MNSLRLGECVDVVGVEGGISVNSLRLESVWAWKAVLV